jgi:hypothetical protein
MAKRKGTEGQETQLPKENDRRTSNTMTKKKGLVLLVLLSPFFGHFVACPSVPFFGHCVACTSVLFFGHCVACPSVPFIWPFCCLSNTMAKRKGTEGQETQLPKENDRRTSNTMTKKKGQKDKQHNGQKKGTEGQATGHCVACPSVPFLWPFCCLSFCPFFLSIVLLVLLSLFFGHCSNTMAKRK